ncbi:hypothetical protein [Gimesia maris]|uniref:hypothetical protein n=1 Tax=Gimesia maris TaxID=122 RepID=UPI0032EBDFD0
MDVLHDLIFGSGTAIKQCQTVSHSNNIEKYVARNSGGASPEFVGVMSAEPRATVTSYDVAGFAGIFGVAGASVSSGTVTLPFRKRASGSTYAGATSHFTMTGANAFGVPTTYSATQGQAASASGEIYFLSSNGIIDPLSSATDATLAAQAFNASYTLGPAGIDGTQIPQVTGITVTTGRSIQTNAYNGYSYATSAEINLIDPTIEITIADFDEIDTYGPMFSSNVGNDVTAFFTKMADGGTRVANATEEHILFTLSGGLIEISEFSASDTSDGSATILITGESLTVSTTSAISFS